jgi:hypothetical protein
MRYLRGHRTPRIPPVDLPTFQRFAAELDSFNELHTKVSGLCSESAVANRHGRAADFPELAHHAAFARGWGAFLQQRGFILHLTPQDALEEGGSDTGTKVQYSLGIDDLERVAAVLEQLIPACYPDRRPTALTNLLRHIEASCEAFATRAEFTPGLLKNHLWIKDLRLLEISLVRVGRHSVASELRFYEKLIAEAPDLFVRYTNLLRLTTNEEVGRARFWIHPNNLSDAFFTAEKAIREIRRTAPVIGSTIERILERLGDCLDLLAVDIEPPQQDHDQKDDGGGAAVAERPRPYRHSGYSGESIQNLYERLDSLRRADALISGKVPRMPELSDPRSPGTI